MELEIQSKKENPLLDRTEVHFIVRHEGESTPKRDLLRTELADKLNVKKENVVVDHMRSRFGRQETVGYAKIHKTADKAKASERKHILKRNNLIAGEAKKKEEKPKEAKPADTAPPAAETEAPAPVAETTPAEPSKEESPKEPEQTPSEEPEPKAEEPPVEEPKPEEKPAEEKPKEPTESEEKKEGQ